MESFQEKYICHITFNKGSFTYYVITKGEGVLDDYANVIVALSNAEFDYGRGQGYRNTQKVIT